MLDDDRFLETLLQSFAPVRRKSLSEEVLDGFRVAIVRGRFKPGDRLSETALAEAFGVSRGPVREALVQLQQEGLVEIERHRGAKVTSISREDVEELYELRVDLERLAVRRACRFVTSEELEEMGGVVSKYGKLVRAGIVEEAVDLDMEFHDAIYRAARHRRLYVCWSSLLRSQIHAFIFSSSVANHAYMMPCISEHAAIHEAIKDRDRERAAELVEHHLRTAYERLASIAFEKDVRGVQD